MNTTRKVKIHNIGSINVLVTMGQTDPSHIEIPTDATEVLKAQGQISFSFSFAGGCAKMYVWTTGKNLLWCGVVPLSGDAEIPLILNPDIKKVVYSGIDLPQCPETMGPRREHFTGEQQHKDGIDFVKVIMIIAVAIVIYGLYQWLSG